jgi:hypothetical protein
MRYLVAIVAIAVVVLLVAVLVGPSLTGSNSGGVAAVLTYSGARPVADRTVGGFGGGGWTLLFAVGLVSPTTETAPTNATALGNLTSYCTYTPVSGRGTTTLPAYSGNRSSGASPAWEFAYRNGSGTVAVVSVIDGQGAVLATLSGIECAIGAALFHSVPANAIDSSQAAAAVQTAAHVFLVAHPNASAVYALIGGIHFESLNVNLQWSIVYSTCSLGATTGTGAIFNATVNPLTGTVVNTSTTPDVPCRSGSSGPAVAPSVPSASLSVPARGNRPLSPG